MSQIPCFGRSTWPHTAYLNRVPKSTALPLTIAKWGNHHHWDTVGTSIPALLHQTRPPMARGFMHRAQPTENSIINRTVGAMYFFRVLLHYMDACRWLFASWAADVASRHSLPGRQQETDRDHKGVG